MTNVLEGRLLLEAGLVHGQVVIEDGVIRSVLTDTASFERQSTRLDHDEILAPGFIDIQINGAFGKEFKTDIDAVEVVSDRLPQFGTTAFCATVTTIAKDSYRDHLAGLRVSASRARGARFLGFHLEGPALNPDKVGAQSADLLVSPEDLDIHEYLDSAVRIVTLAPELPGSRDFIDALIATDVRVGVGHSTIAYDELVELFDPAHMVIVHAFNAMSDLNSRKPGIIGAVLDRDDYYASVIADRIHVSDPSLRILWKAKVDKTKLIAITDGSAVTGLDVGTHTIGARTIEKRSDRAVLQGTETLVGSTLTLDVAVRNLKEVTGCTAAEALACVTHNPARFLGLEGEVGRLAVGARADIVVLTEDLRVQRTIVDGRTVWER
jgi:N-acetylglucosamine-6-phosphate deacetylase